MRYFAQIFPERRGLSEMTRQTNVLACKPEQVFLALAHIENKLSRACLLKEERNIPLNQLQGFLNISCPILTMDMRHTTAAYSRISLEPEISRLQGLKPQGTPSIVDCPKHMQDTTDKVSWPAELLCWTKFSDQGNAQKLHC